MVGRTCSTTNGTTCTTSSSVRTACIRHYSTCTYSRRPRASACASCTQRHNLRYIVLQPAQVAAQLLQTVAQPAPRVASIAHLLVCRCHWQAIATMPYSITPNPPCSLWHLLSTFPYRPQQTSCCYHKVPHLHPTTRRQMRECTQTTQAQ